jgi:predicted PurR-regulated permease PerM
VVDADGLKQNDDRDPTNPHPEASPRHALDPGHRETGWRARDILRAAILVAAVYLGLQLLWFASSLFFVVFLGLLFGLALSGGTDALKAHGVPRVIGTVLIVLLFLGSLAGLGALLAPTLTRQTDELREQLPAAIDRLESWLEGQQDGVVGMILSEPAAQDTGQAADTVPAAVDEEPSDNVEESPVVATLRDRLTNEFGSVTRYLFPFVSSTLAVLGGVLAILFIAIYIAVQPDLYHRGILHLLPHEARPKAELVLGRMAIMLRRWLVTQLVAMLAVGLITTGTLVLLDVPSAVALGVLAGLLEFVPIIGPIIAAVPAIAMAFLAGPQTALIVTVAFVIIQQVESQLITPILMKEGVDLPPVLTLVTQSIMAAVFGFIGLIVAVPLLASAMVPIKILYVEDVVGDPMQLPGDD